NTRKGDAFLNVTKVNVMHHCTTLKRFLTGTGFSEEDRLDNVPSVNKIADYLSGVTLPARELLAFLVSLDRPVDLYELARHNGEAEPNRTSRLMLELQHRKLAYIEEGLFFEDEIPYEVKLWPGDRDGSVLDGWVEFWEQLRDHFAERDDATLGNVIVGLDFSLLD
ncbi:hypothetical protein, partial [Streptomyces mirabilis]|uniref:hypothetical protein n=1 Tax=Streptomyces mirabilis TaxID=68239 RepID=UPI0034492C3C